MRIGGRSWWAPRTLLLVGMGGLAALLAWAAGPRVALAVAVGGGTAAGLVGMWWLRTRLRQLETGLTTHLRQLDAAHHAGLARVRAELSAMENRISAGSGAELSAAVKQLRGELDSVEKHIRIATSGDLASMEKRLRREAR